jgi:hypothetical protein
MDWVCVVAGIPGGLLGYWVGLMVQRRRIVRRLAGERLQWEMRK